MASSIDSHVASETDSSNPTIVQKMGVCLLCFASFLLLYLIMAGPLVWVEDKMKFSPFTRSVETLYAPLVLVVKSDIKPASSMIKAYVGLFK